MVVGILALVVSIAIVVIGAVWFRIGDAGNGNRQEAFTRAKAFLWGITGAAIVGGLFLLLGLAWFVIGNTWMFATGSDNLVPSNTWANRLQTFILWPYEQVSFAISGQGKYEFWP